MLRRNSF